MDNIVPQDTPQRQCICCLIIKPFNDFWKSTINSDGIEHTCIECRYLMKQGKIVGFKEASVQGRILSGMKECNTCHRSLPLISEFFNRSSRLPDGFAYICRECRMASRRNPPKPRTIPEGMKQCCMCKQVLPADREHFNVSNREPDGLNPRCTPCHRAYNREWSHKKQPLKGPHIKDGKKRCSICKEWLPLTRDYFYQSSDADFGFNSRCIICIHKKMKDYRDAHPEIYAAYYANHIEERRIMSHRRRALQKGCKTTYTVEQIQEQYKRQKGKCYYCGVKIQGKKYHVDHVVPVSRYGSNEISNLVVSCPTCNLRKHNKLPHEWPEGGRLM